MFLTSKLQIEPGRCKKQGWTEQLAIYNKNNGWLVHKSNQNKEIKSVCLTLTPLKFSFLRENKAYLELNMFFFHAKNRKKERCFLWVAKMEV